MNVAVLLATNFMNVIDVQHILAELFQEQLTHNRHRHIVFWYDELGEFVDEINDIHLENVRIWQFSENNLFETKYELEVNDIQSNFLLYANMAKPIPREDWLFNLSKLGSEFTADKITIYMRKLGLNDDKLRHVFMEYGQFFRSNARFESFRKYPVDRWTESAIDLNILSALTKSKINTVDEIVKALFHHQYNQRYDAWAEIQKYGNEEKFWSLVEEHFGYTLEKSLQSLLTFLMITYVSEQNVDITYPKTWLAHVSKRPTNVIVFIDQWMNHRTERDVYNGLADQISDLMKIDLYIKEWDIHELSTFDAFRIFDERIIAYIVNQLQNNVGRFNEYEALILNRRKTHWYVDYHVQYEALLQAIYFLKRVAKLEKFIPEESAEQLIQTYTKTYYKLDTAYRKFYISFDKLPSKELFRPLQQVIENTYTNWFIHELSLKWTDSLMRKAERTWFLPHIQKQNEFFNDWVQPFIKRKQRVFVIVSDALRFEVAKDLMECLNNERKASTTLDVIQGVLPSYTALGMASLLPHEEIKINDNEVFVDGIRASNTKNRRKILQHYVTESAVFTYEDINKMDRETMRESFAGMDVVYIYHNNIDAVGDNPATEIDVFNATEEAINEIRVLTNRLVNNISASNILITADHGFIYQRDKVELSQLIRQDVENSSVTSRRFILSKHNPHLDGTLTFGMDEMLQEENEQYVTVPKGIHRFQVQGAGANFVHGGAMLQEIVIPVITFKNDRTKSSENVVRHVDVKLTNLSRKITSEVVLLEFFQVSSVEDKVLPRQLRAYFVDESGIEISSECRIIADLTANEALERVWKERFILKSLSYDRTKNYCLILEDDEGKVYEKYEFVIDIIS